MSGVSAVCEAAAALSPVGAARSGALHGTRRLLAVSPGVGIAPETTPVKYTHHMLNIRHSMWWDGKKSPYRATYRERSWLERSQRNGSYTKGVQEVLQRKYSREALQMAVDMIPSGFRVADVPRPPQRIRMHSEGVVGRWYTNYWTLHSIRYQLFLVNHGLPFSPTDPRLLKAEEKKWDVRGGEVQSTAPGASVRLESASEGAEQETNDMKELPSPSASPSAFPVESSRTSNPPPIIAWKWGERDQPRTHYEEPHMYVDFEETKAIRDYRSRWINTNRSLVGMSKRMKAAEEEARFLSFKRTQEQFWSNRKVFVNRVKSMSNQGSLTSSRDLPLKTFNLKAFLSDSSA